MPYMQSYSAKIHILSLLIAVFCFFAFSCSQSAPEINQPDYSVIFDYTNEEELPASRLAVFMNSSSDVRRYETLRIKSVDTGYVWTVTDIIRLSQDEQKWAGCNNLFPPENERIPSGSYEITYINADQKEASFIVQVSYDAAFYDTLLADLPTEIRSKNGIEKIIIFDKEKKVLFFGPRPAELRTVRDIWNAYREADTYRVLWYTSNGRVICMEPERKVAPEEDKEEEN